MSSKTQLNDALKRANKIINELNNKVDLLAKENYQYKIWSENMVEQKKTLFEQIRTYQTKKWWQFWK